MLPSLSSYEPQRIRKGGQGLAVPGILPNGDIACIGVRVGQQGDQAEQSQQGLYMLPDAPGKKYSKGRQNLGILRWAR